MPHLSPLPGRPDLDIRDIPKLWDVIRAVRQLTARIDSLHPRIDEGNATLVKWALLDELKLSKRLLLPPSSLEDTLNQEASSGAALESVQRQYQIAGLN